MFQWEKQLGARRNLYMMLSDRPSALVKPTYIEIEAIRKVDIVGSVHPYIKFRAKSGSEA